jgi:glycosyltransferase involved in cell wall biosynthesis
LKLSIIIVNYNVKQYVENCLKTVYAAGKDIEMEIFVVDNDSTDGSIDYLRERFPDVKYIENGQNLGFSRANNVAIRQAVGEYVLLLNPDTTISENVLSECIAFADAHPKTGAIGVRMHNEDGTIAPESRRAVPTPWIALCKYLGYNRFSEAVALAALDSDEHYRRVADDMEWGRQLYKKELGNLPGFKVYKSVANFILIKYPLEIKDALMDALKIQNYKIKFMGDKGLESCLRITLGRKEQTQTVVDTILKVVKEQQS